MGELITIGICFLLVGGAVAVKSYSTEGLCSIAGIMACLVGAVSLALGLYRNWKKKGA